MDVTVGNIVRPDHRSIVHMRMAVRSTRRWSPVAISAQIIAAWAVDSHNVHVQVQVARAWWLPSQADDWLGDTTIKFGTLM